MDSNNEKKQPKKEPKKEPKKQPMKQQKKQQKNEQSTLDLNNTMKQPTTIQLTTNSKSSVEITRINQMKLNCLLSPSKLRLNLTNPSNFLGK